MSGRSTSPGVVTLLTALSADHWTILLQSPTAAPESGANWSLSWPLVAAQCQLIADLPPAVQFAAINSPASGLNCLHPRLARLPQLKPHHWHKFSFQAQSWCTPNSKVAVTASPINFGLRCFTPNALLCSTHAQTFNSTPHTQINGMNIFIQLMDKIIWLIFD